MDNTLNNTSNKYTGKERDQETGYDYFGARYYDSRISVWLSPDPLFEKHLQWSPYNYVLRNPFVLIDPDGRQIDVIGGTKEEREDFIIFLNQKILMDYFIILININDD